MKIKEVEVLDIDGTGIFSILSLLKRNFKVTHYSIKGESRITRFAEKNLSPMNVRFIIDSINNGRLSQSSKYMDAGRSGTLIISYVSGLSKDFSDNDVLRLVQRIAKNFSDEFNIICVGLTFPGFMNKLVEVINRENHVQPPVDKAVHYLPLPLLVGRRVPIGGLLTRDVWHIIRAVIGTRKMVNGLGLLEAEVAAIGLILKRILLEITAIECLLLSRKLELSPKKVLKNGLGKGVELSLLMSHSHPALKIIERIESNLLMGRGILRTLMRMSKMAEMDFVNRLNQLRKGRDRLNILVVGRELKILRGLPSRKFMIHRVPRMTPSELEKKLKIFAEKYDLIVFTSRNKYVSKIIKSSVSEGTVIINLCDYVGEGE